MARTLSATFQVEETVAHQVVGFELCRELGRPPVLEIDVRFLGDVTPIQAVGRFAALTFGHEGEPPHAFAGVVESVTVAA